MLNSFKRGMFTIGTLAFLQSLPAKAADSAAAEFGVSVYGILSTVIYSVLGLIILMLAFKAFDILTPYKLHKELAEDQNVAVGVLLCGIFIALSIVIAASIV